ncbi:hypothetical protein BZA70DRAFT_279280 [Myxozyma melibiosi]|uniref:Endoplasmic reticulum junction formation protein lunapark n=1 Tax=Myxozyma melibiosi TaxID=54550 RepID=A0ABR1F5R6_9ASCO
MWPFKRRSPSPSSYEKILDTLASKIRKSESKIHSLRLSQRRLVGLLTLYSLLLYLAFLVYVALSNRYREPWMVFHALAAPVLIWLTRRLITAVYTRLLKREDSNLQVLRASQKAKIEELKSSMKYYTTKSLIDRFEADSKTDSDSKKDAKTRGRSKQKDLPAAPVDPVPAGEEFFDESQLLQQQELQQQLNQMQYTSNLRQLPATTYEPRDPKWYDRILDVIVGEDEMSPRNRYALLCSRCGTHNGLAPPGQEPSEVRYRCPVCGQWNPEKENAGDDDKEALEDEDAEEKIEESETVAEIKEADSVPSTKKTTKRRAGKSKSSEDQDEPKATTTGLE